MLPQSLRPAGLCALAAAVGLLSGCSLVEPEPEQIQIHVYDVFGPEQAAPGEALTFTLHGAAFDASLRIGSRSDQRADVTAWAPKPRPDAWFCASPPPLLGHFEAVMPAAGTYVLRALQPDGSVLEKRVRIAG